MEMIKENSKFVSTLISEDNGIAHWTNEEKGDNKWDTYIDKVYYPTSYLYQGGNSEGLKTKLMEMKLDYKGLNRIWKLFGEYSNLSRKLNIEQLVDIIVLRTLAKVNSWIFCKEDGKWTVIKPYK